MPLSATASLHGAPGRLALGLLVALSGLALAGWGFAQASAAWLLFSPDVPDAELLDASALTPALAWSPGDGNYTYWMAQRALTEYRRLWLTATAPDLGQQALGAAVRARRAVPANPYAHALAAAAALQVARHPRTSEDETARLLDESLGELRKAGQLWPGSPRLARHIAAILIERWDIAGTEGRTLALAMTRRAATLSNNPRRDFPALLDALVARLLVDPGRAEDVLAALDEAIPETPLALEVLARSLFQTIDAAKRTDAELVHGGIEILRRIAATTDMDLAALRRWQQTWAARLPDESALRQQELLELTRAHPQRAAPWLVLAEQHLARGERVEAIAAANEAQELARGAASGDEFPDRAARELEAADRLVQSLVESR